MVNFDLSNPTTMKKLLIAAIIAASMIGAVSAEMRSPKKDVAANIEIFSSIIKQLQNNYVDTIDMNDIVKYGVGAMLSRLDPYTEYFDRQEQQDFKDRNVGEYGGIGSYIAFRDNYVHITGPREGSPAAKAGLRTGDKILEINGEDMKGKSVDEVSSKLRGTLGSTVDIKISRPWTDDSILTVSIERDKIQVPSVPYYGVVGDGIGYIMLDDFLEKSGPQFKDALNDLMKNNAIKGLIIDLRGNGGGYLQSAVEILGHFLPKGTEVLHTRGRVALEDRIYKTTSKPTAPDLPLVVLIDGSTASSSEIVSGALQDLDRAVIVGNRSFGKGLVQSTFSLPNEGMMKLTTAKYYIPSGRLIQAIDYSKRATDGSAKRIADSLTNEFRTAAGRIVRDGGGITPDITIEYPDVSRITYNAVTDNWVERFSTKYFAEHPDRPDPDDIVVTDSIYADFKRFIDPAQFNYDKVCESALQSLRELAKIEGYMSDEVDQQITVLEGMMKHSLDQDLDTHRQAIEPYILSEIAERYYYDRGRYHVALRSDEAVKKAVELLEKPDGISSILTPADTRK